MIAKVKAQTSVGMKSKMTTVTLRLKPKEDLKVTLEKFVKTNKIKAACIITCAGSLDVASIRFANLSNATRVPGKLEIVSLTGTLAESGSHIHISVSDSSGKTTGGHLQDGSLIYTTAEIVIGILPDVEFSREADPAYGYKELIVKPKPKSVSH
ncbi:DNA-binding protein [Segetibacter aerophilus]|uniref:DNA-binding protein n=1 Tax=Segetibacter aerophilus TaxID=670293 RepID=A0A512B8F0_9BACT|nr:DNA-binding protein [Segetibacter aerophilus]